jgi:hypothetical protein
MYCRLLPYLNTVYRIAAALYCVMDFLESICVPLSHGVYIFEDFSMTVFWRQKRKALFILGG